MIWVITATKVQIQTHSTYQSNQALTDVTLGYLFIITIILKPRSLWHIQEHTAWLMFSLFHTTTYSDIFVNNRCKRWNGWMFDCITEC